MIYIIITTCLINIDENKRKEQYIRGINSLIEKVSGKNCKIVIVENNGKRETFLDDFNLPVLYTDNNKIVTKNIGIKELKDIHDCIKHFDIQDDDLIVKMTGRYYFNKDSEFIDVLDEKYDCIIRYGSYLKPTKEKCMDCITGLIAMKCKYVKQIEYPADNECVEWKYAKMTYQIPDDKIYVVNKLGINIAPGSNKYFLV